MNIGSIPYYTFPSIGQAISMSQSGRTSVPVAPSSFIYSQFKHISGVPAPDGMSGVSISKLKILDTLIDQISKMKKQPDPPINMNFQETDPQLGSLIDKYQDQIRKIQTDGAKSMYPPQAPMIGAIFNIAV